MANLRKPTRDQKEIMKEHGLKWENWLVKGEDNNTLVVVNRESGRKRVLLK